MRTITTRHLKERLDRNGGLTLVHVLSEESFREKHIPGSVNVPHDRDDFAREVRRAAGGEEVIVYCASASCDASPKAAKQLEQAGFADVAVLEGGVAEWEERGLPLEGTAVGAAAPAEAAATRS